jgi:hypothetical protein
VRECSCEYNSVGSRSITFYMQRVRIWTQNVKLTTKLVRLCNSSQHRFFWLFQYLKLVIVFVKCFSMLSLCEHLFHLLSNKSLSSSIFYQNSKVSVKHSTLMHLTPISILNRGTILKDIWRKQWLIMNIKEPKTYLKLDYRDKD